MTAFPALALTPSKSPAHIMYLATAVGPEVHMKVRLAQPSGSGESNVHAQESGFYLWLDESKQENRKPHFPRHHDTLEG